MCFYGIHGKFIGFVGTSSDCDLNLPEQPQHFLPGQAPSLPGKQLSLLSVLFSQQCPEGNVASWLLLIALNFYIGFS